MRTPEEIAKELMESYHDGTFMKAADAYDEILGTIVARDDEHEAEKQALRDHADDGKNNEKVEEAHGKARSETKVEQRHVDAAKELVHRWVFDSTAMTDEDSPRAKSARRQLLEQRIAFALYAIEHVSPGCIRDDRGVVRRVLGRMSVTADGLIVTGGAIVFHAEEHIYAVVPGFRGNAAVEFNISGNWRPLDECYSTREAAAQAAREPKP